MPPFIQSYLRLGTAPDDRQSVRLAKAQFTGSAPIVTVLVLAFGGIYLSYQEWSVAYVAFGCGILSTFNVACFALVHRNLELAFNIQAALAFVTGLMAVFLLGSFANS